MGGTRRRLGLWALVCAACAIALLCGVYFVALNGKTPRCSGPSHLVCVLDENGGTIDTFFGLFAVIGVAVSAVGIGFVVKDIRAERVSFETVLIESVYEAVHNVHHLAGGIEENWPNWPALSTRMARRLLEPDKLVPLRELGHVAPAGRPVWAHADHIIRNDEYIRLAMARDPAPSSGLKDALGYTIEHCVRFIIDAARVDTGCREIMYDAQVGTELLGLVEPKSDWYQAVYWIRISIDKAIEDLSEPGKVDPATRLLIAWQRPDNTTDLELIERAQAVRLDISRIMFIGEPFKRMPDPPHRSLG